MILSVPEIDYGRWLKMSYRSYRYIEESCDRCRGQLISSNYPGYAYCPRCREYRPSQAPWAGQKFGPFWISERCQRCSQPIIDTADPSINYCPNCGLYQYDRTGY